MQQPKVSVIVPCYNGRALLGRALDSLRAQTLADWEAVVVDDGSEAGRGAREVVEAMADRRIRLVSHDHNRGLAAAHNTGVAAARGRWVTRLDCDDTMPPKALELLVGAAARAGADMAWGGHRRINPDAADAVAETVMPPRPKAPGRAVDLNDLPVTVYTMSQWGKLVRRELIAAQPAYEGLDRWEDVSVWARILALRPQIAFVDTPVYDYRVARRGESLSTAGAQRVLHDHIGIARRLDEWFAAEGLDGRYEHFLLTLKFMAKVKLLRCRPRRPGEWRRTFPEVNGRIMQLRHIPLHYRLLFRLFAL